MDSMTPIAKSTSVLVARDYSAQYHDPIDVPAGVVLDVVGPDVDNQSWWWCRAPDGRMGWVRSDLLEPAPTRGTKSRIRQAHTARELDARRGERLLVLEEYAGWVFVQNGSGARGWVPVTRVVEEPRSAT